MTNELQQTRQAFEVSTNSSIALVTGGAKRVGRAIVLELARAGYDVAVHYRNNEYAARELVANVLASGRRSVALHADLTDEAAWPNLIAQTVAALGGVDVLVNNASQFLSPTPDTLEGFDPSLWETMFRVHMLAPFALVHHARRHLARSGRGCVINLCDISSERPWPDHLAYCATKAGLVALTRGLARAMAPAVRVNAISPGIATFPDEYGAVLRLQITRQVPLLREGTPEGVARLVRFLVDSADYVTGQVIAIDGGRGVV